MSFFNSFMKTFVRFRVSCIGDVWLYWCRVRLSEHPPDSIAPHAWCANSCGADVAVDAQTVPVKVTRRSSRARERVVKVPGATAARIRGPQATRNGRHRSAKAHVCAVARRRHELSQRTNRRRTDAHGVCGGCGRLCGAKEADECDPVCQRRTQSPFESQLMSCEHREGGIAIGLAASGDPISPTKPRDRRQRRRPRTHAFWSNPVGSKLHPYPPNTRPLQGGLIFGGEGGIRTHVPGYPDHLISSQRRCDRFGTSPAGANCSTGTVARTSPAGRARIAPCATSPHRSS